MTDLGKRLAAKERLTPKTGYTLVGVDEYETDPELELYPLEHFEDVALAEKALAAARKADPDRAFYLYGPSAPADRGPPLIVLKDAAAMTPEQLEELVKGLNAGAK